MPPVAAAGRICQVRKRGSIRRIVDIDAVTETIVGNNIECRIEHSSHGPKRDVGDIVTEGATDLTSDAPSDFAVIGGTGAYGGVRGTGHVVHVPGTDLNRAVLTFVR